MIIKVCGMRDTENIREVEKLADELPTLNSQLSTFNSQLSTLWMGFIFWPKSSRYVCERPAYLPQKIKKAGVFVDATIDDITQKVQDYGLDIIQLHGHESPAFIKELSTRFSPCSNSVGGRDGVFFIKAFNIGTKDDFEATKPYEGLVDYFLFDAKAQLPGGNGQQFDWSVLADYAGETPFLLSGGIGPDDAERVKSFHHPRCIGIDLNSRFEIAPALKAINKLKEFIEKVR